MKIKGLMLFGLFFINHCLAQKRLQQLKDISYYSPSGEMIQNIRLTKDSLFFAYIYASGDVKDWKYEILEEEKIANYFLVYLKLPPVKLKLPNNVTPPQRIILYIFSFSKYKDQLYMLRDGANYRSIEEARIANTSIPFNDEFFVTWYQKTKFDSIVKYPELKNTDKATMQKAVADWSSSFKANSNKMQNHKYWNIYLSLFTRELWNSALISNHINPLVHNDEIYDELVKYHIGNPSMIKGKDNTIQLRIDTGNSKNKVRIDEPLGNK